MELERNNHSRCDDRQVILMEHACGVMHILKVRDEYQMLLQCQLVVGLKNNFIAKWRIERLIRREADPGSCDADRIVAAYSVRRLKDQSCTEVSCKHTLFASSGSKLQK